MDGFVTISANAAPDSDSTFPYDMNAPTLSGSLTINHNLGYVPLVRASWDPGKNDIWYNCFYNYVVDPRLKIIATSTYVKLMVGTDGAAKTNIPVFYRIYDTGNVAVTSDSAIDKIFLKGNTSGSVPLSGNSFTESELILTIPHSGGLPVPGFSLEFSEDQTNWYQEGMQIQGPWDTTTGPPGGPYSRFFFTACFGRIDANNLYIHLRNNYATAKTVYARYAVDYKI